MFRKRNRLKNQLLEKLNQKGASVIILALIIMVFMSITILGITKLTISEKKRAKSTSVSAEAYQKADEAMECALWGRNEIIKACSDKAEDNNLYFPQDITGETDYCNKYEDKVKPFHLATDADGINTMEEIPTCASPFYISLFTSKGQAEIEEDNAFTGKMTKQRGIGATVHTSDGDSESSLFKPYVCCNKIASKGNINATITNRCNEIETDDHPNILASDNGPDSSRGWLEDHYWEPCTNICLEDPCAYYNTGLTEDLSDDELLDENTDEGAHWCWTDDINTELGTEGSMCNCMSEHTDSGDGDEYKYWIHLDIEEFCSPCNRLENNLACNGESTGNICGNMAKKVGYPEEISDEQINKIWGTGGLPPESCQGVLTENNCYSCNCKPDLEICSNCTQDDNGVYECAEENIPPENLMLTWPESHHTEDNCEDLTGIVATTDSGITFCRYRGSIAPDGWFQAGNWQRYSQTGGGGDECTHWKDSAPTTFSNSGAYRYTKGTYVQLGHGCSSNGWSVYFQSGMWNWYTLNTYTNQPTYRVEIGIY